ncbi:hypothetical protein QUB44_12750 [Microcoleus sp. AT3-D2]
MLTKNYFSDILRPTRPDLTNPVSTRFCDESQKIQEETGFLASDAIAPLAAGPSRLSPAFEQ